MEVVTECNELPVHPRHPYAGELVFCAFSGTHQDAIKKGFASRQKTGGHWEIPYLPIDPQDIGCAYEAIVRVNSQSGKGGVSYIIQQRIGLDMPRKMQVAFYQVIQAVTDRTGKEMSPDEIEKIFRTTYHFGEGFAGRFVLLDYNFGRSPDNDGHSGSLSVRSPQNSKGFMNSSPSNLSQTEPGAKNRYFKGTILDGSRERIISGTGNGPISSLLDALLNDCDVELSVREFTEAAIGQGSDTHAASFVELVDKAGKGTWGVAGDVDVTAAILQAVLSAVNGSVLQQEDFIDEVDANLATTNSTTANLRPSNGIAISPFK